MIIKKIIIKNLGNVKSFEYDFSKGLNIVNTVKMNRQVIIMTFGRDAKTVEQMMLSVQNKQREEIPSEWCR